jgi:2-dehydropantoate 2-reductase
VRVLVVGAGAIGSLLGWALAVGGIDVTIVRRRASTIGAAKLVVEPPYGRPAVAPVAVVRTIDGTAQPDVILIAVKQYDLAEAVAALAAMPQAIVVTAQNGIGAENHVAGTRPVQGLIAASVTASVELAPDGTVRWLRRGGIGLAAARGHVEPALATLLDAFGQSGLDARRYADADAMKWSKLVANLVGNATSALLDMAPQAIYAEPTLFAIERAQLREAVAVVRGLNLRLVDLPGAPVRLLAAALGLPAAVARPVLARAVGGARGGKDPSLRAAVGTGGPTEVHWLNGAVVRAAAHAGLAVPVNARLERLVNEVATDADRRRWFARRPDRLIAEFRPA